MSIEKHITVTGSSTVSWKDAIIKTISKASEKIQAISSVRIIDQRGKIVNGIISEYFVDLDITFIVEQ